MKEDSTHRPGTADPGADPEIWISGEEVKKLFPDVLDRQLKYWRDSKKIRFKTIRNRSWYIEEDIRGQVKLLVRPLKRSRLRAKWIPKKLRSIHPVLALAIMAVLFMFLIDHSYMKGEGYSYSDVTRPFVLILTCTCFYGIIILAKYCWKRLFRKKSDKNQ